jgi:putative membrane protein
MKSYLKIYAKGILMGICDLIPGISGGTIAFITGIYERLISALKSFNLSLLLDIMKFLLGRGDKQKLRQDLKALDLPFLIILFAGILTSILLISKLIIFLLNNYFVYTMVFFIGLIVASSKIIFSHIEKHHSLNTLVALIGILVGISFLFIVPSHAQPSLWYIVLSGFFAISAMLLPGISGSFILLIMGTYQFMLEALQDIPQNIIPILLFLIGALLGFFVMSRLIFILFKKDKSKTLYFLLGLVIGSLSIPIKEILSQSPVLNLQSIMFMILLFVVGAGLAIFVTSASQRRK